MLEYWEKVVNRDVRFDMHRIKSWSDDGEPIKPNDLQEKLLASHGVVLAPTTDRRYRDFKGFDGAKIAVIPVSGPLMKADFCGDFGTASLRRVMLDAANTKSVETIILLMDTPGGTVDGTEAFADAYKKVGEQKNTITFVDQMMCSAGMWIGSAGNMLVASGKTDIVGSIGTMMAWYDATEYNKKEGFILREYYASKSTDKNRAFREARDGDGKRLIAEELDPLNSVFLQSVKANRGDKLSAAEDVFTGKCYLSEEAIKHGLIDGIMTLEECISHAMELAPKHNKKSYSMKKNSNTAAAFQSVLEVVNAESLAVVDGGFLMTEEQLNTLNDAVAQVPELEATIAEQRTTTRTLTTRVEELEAAAQEHDVEGLTQQLNDAKAAQKTAEDKLATTEATVTQLTEQLESAGEGAATFFGQQNAGADPKPAHDGGGNEYKVEEQPYMKQAIANMGYMNQPEKKEDK